MTDVNNSSYDSYICVFDDSKFKILKKDKDYYIVTFEKGIKLTDINDVLLKLNIEVDNFINLRNAITTKFNEIIHFGLEKEKINIIISKDNMKAYVIIDNPNNEVLNVDKMIPEIEILLNKNNVSYGINFDLLRERENIPSNTMILVAEGEPAINGENSVTRTLKVNDGKPKEKEDGTVDHFELGLINLVNEKDWLGEWTKPTDGKDGINVRGNVIKAKPGKLVKILYDTKSVVQKDVGDKIILYSRSKGAFNIDHRGVIKVSNHIILDNVDYNTGNIDFNGYVTILGTVEDGFSVYATDDIEIKGEVGLGAVKEIFSKNGNILISGGINGKDRSIIKANNVVSKYISHAKVYVNKVVTVNNYILNSIIESQEIIMNSINSQISGGEITATKITVGSLGNISESKTCITLNKIEKDSINKIMQDLTDKIEENKSKIYKIDKMIMDDTVPTEKYDDFIAYKSELTTAMKSYEADFNSLKRYVSIKGDSQIKLHSCVYPQVRIKSLDEVKVFKDKVALSFIYTREGLIITE